jgi:hypothetical protein
LNFTTLLGEMLTKQLKLKDNTSVSWEKTIALTTLNDLANLLHLTISIKLVDRRTKHYSQPITW